MTNENYITIQGWMINELGLKGNELLCFAIIYGFCQDEQSVFSGTSSYLANSMQITRPAVFEILKKLVAKGYLEKVDKVQNGVSLCDYKINLQGIKKLYRGYKETLQGGYKETLHHNNNIDNTRDNKEIYKESLDKEFSIFWDEYKPVVVSSGKCVAKGSKTHSMVKFEKIIKAGVSSQDIISGLRRYLEYCAKNDILSCTAEVFLNQKRWEYDYGLVKNKQIIKVPKENPLDGSMMYDEAGNVIYEYKEVWC